MFQQQSTFQQQGVLNNGPTMITVQQKMMEHLARGVYISTGAATAYQALVSTTNITSTMQTTGTASGMGTATHAQKAVLLGWTGVELQHLNFFLNEHLDGFWGKLLTCPNKPAKRSLIKTILAPALLLDNPDLKCCLTEDFYETILNQAFVPQVSATRKAPLGLGPLTFARRTVDVISNHELNYTTARRATYTTAVDLTNQRLDTPVLPENPDDYIALLTRMATAHITMFSRYCKLANEVNKVVTALRVVNNTAYAQGPDSKNEIDDNAL